MCPCLALTTPLSPAPVCTFIFTHHLSHLDKQEKSYHLPLALCCSSVKRCCVTSSWWQAAWRCRLTGWSWRPVALTSVPCSQVHTHTHTRTVVCLASIFMCVCADVCLTVCVCRWYEREQGPSGGDPRGGRTDSEKTGGLHLHGWDRGHGGQRTGESDQCVRLDSRKISHPPWILQNIDVLSRHCRHVANKNYCLEFVRLSDKSAEKLNDLRTDQCLYE